MGLCGSLSGGGLGENGYIYMYGWVALLCTWSYHNIVNQLYANIKWKVKKKPNPQHRLEGKLSSSTSFMTIRWINTISLPRGLSQGCDACAYSTASDSLWPTDCSLPGSSVHGILQARLEWVAMPSGWLTRNIWSNYIYLHTHTHTHTHTQKCSKGVTFPNEISFSLPLRNCNEA